jgi:hypothetical protein
VKRLIETSPQMTAACGANNPGVCRYDLEVYLTRHLSTFFGLVYGVYLIVELLPNFYIPSIVVTFGVAVVLRCVPCGVNLALLRH